MTAQRLHTVTGATSYTSRYIAQLLLQQVHRVQSITHHHPSWGRGLSRGLLVSRSGEPAPRPTRFSEWLDEHSDQLGRSYTN